MTYRSVVLADAPVHLWDLQDASGTTAADGTAGTPDNGTYNGGFTLGATGPHSTIESDKGVTFNGTSGYVSAPTVADLNITGDLTLEMWVKPNNRSNHHWLINRLTTGASAYYEWRLENSSGIPMFAHGSGAVNGYGTTAPTVGIWNHVAVKRVGNVITHYLNGLPNGSATLQAIGTVVSTTPLTIGTRETDHYSFANYSAAYAAVYGSALSDAQILAHYNAGFAPDLRVSQVVADVLIKPASADVPINISQVVADVLVQPDSPHVSVQVSQVTVDALTTVPVDTVGTRVSQITVDALVSVTQTVSTGYKLLPTIM